MTDSESESGEEEATETEGDAAVKSPEKSSWSLSPFFYLRI